MKKIVSLIPLFSIYILTLALFKVYIYYNNFKIPIKYFINVSELTVNIFEDLLYIFPSLIIIYFLIDKTDPKFDPNEIKDRIKSLLNIKVKGKNLIETIKLFIKKCFRWVTLIYCLLLFLGVPLLMIICKRNYSEKVAGFIFLGCIIMLFILIANNNKIIEMLTLDGMILSSILLALTFAFALTVLIEIEKTENEKYIGTKVITEDSTYISTYNNYYIGQTSSYIFLFNKKQNNPTIINSSKVSRIELSIKK